MTTTTLPVAALRTATARLLDAVEKKLGAEVLLADDFYWNVPLGEATDVHREPRLDLASVVDDAESVREFAARDRDEWVAIWHQCEHIAGVLRSIGMGPCFRCWRVPGLCLPL
ncbi:hypothetical protein [Micropruina sp.]|uniref:hypothetical protein n=1 Tax=Micropruina sp. TaxID=2737536 RepID=UPI0039E5DE99